MYNNQCEDGSIRILNDMLLLSIEDLQLMLNPQCAASFKAWTLYLCQVNEEKSKAHNYFYKGGRNLDIAYSK